MLGLASCPLCASPSGDTRRSIPVYMEGRRGGRAHCSLLCCPAPPPSLCPSTSSTALPIAAVDAGLQLSPNLQDRLPAPPPPDTEAPAEQHPPRNAGFSRGPVLVTEASPRPQPERQELPPYTSVFPSHPFNNPDTNS